MGLRGLLFKLLESDADTPCRYIEVYSIKTKIKICSAQSTSEIFFVPFSFIKITFINSRETLLLFWKQMTQKSTDKKTPKNPQMKSFLSLTV